MERLASILQREQDLVDLAGVGLLAGEEEVAGHLHRDRAGALPAAAGEEVAKRGAQRCRGVHAACSKKRVVLGREDRVLHDSRDVPDAHEAAPLLAEFADQHAIGRVDPQRDLRPVVGHRVQRGQVRLASSAAIARTSSPATTASAGTRPSPAAVATRRSRARAVRAPHRGARAGAMDMAGERSGGLGLECHGLGPAGSRRLPARTDLYSSAPRSLDPSKRCTVG